MLKTLSAIYICAILISVLTSCASQKSAFNESALLGNGSVSYYTNDKITPEHLTNTVSSPQEQQLKEYNSGHPIFIVKERDFALRYMQADTAKDSVKEPEPRLQPLIPAGDAIFALGVAAVAVSVLSGGLSIFIGIAAILAGLCLTSIGYKKVKKEPKKWKGEKLALALYYALIPVGLFLMLYPVYLLFIL